MKFEAPKNLDGAKRLLEKLSRSTKGLQESKRNQLDTLSALGLRPYDYRGYTCDPLLGIGYAIGHYAATQEAPSEAPESPESDVVAEPDTEPTPDDQPAIDWTHAEYKDLVAEMERLDAWDNVENRKKDTLIAYLSE